MGLEFAEKVLWKRQPQGGHLATLTCLWNDGVYLGVKGSTGEIAVGSKEGIFKTRTVQRKPKELRWAAENLSLIVGVPWRMSENDPGADGEAMRGKVIDLRDGEAIKENDRETVKELLKLNLPRSFRTKDEDYQRHGYSRGCAGCKALLGNTTRQKHSEACRRRMTEALAGQRRVTEAQERKKRFIEEALQAEEENRHGGGGNHGR